MILKILERNVSQTHQVAIIHKWLSVIRNSITGRYGLTVATVVVSSYTPAKIFFFKIWKEQY